MKSRFRARLAGVAALALLALAASARPAAAQANVAAGKPATQSSSPYGATGTAAAAVDGNTNGEWNNGSVSHTDVQGPWWQVDLGGVYDISRIRIWNRTDCCRERLRGFWILVSETPYTGDPRSGPSFGGGAQSFGDEDSREFRPSSPTRGRWVRIALDHDDYLSLAEVEVYGTPVADDGMVAPSPISGFSGGDAPPAPPATVCPPGMTPAGPGVCAKAPPRPRERLVGGADVMFNPERARARCAERYPQGCDIVGGMLVPRCKPDETDMGMMCMQRCPPGWADEGGVCRSTEAPPPPVPPDGAVDIDQVQAEPGTAIERVPYIYPDDLAKVMDWIENQAIGAKLPFCWRDSYSDAGRPVSDCPSGTVPDRTGGPLSLCYPPCAPDYDDVSFVCWQRCPPDFTNDGGFCRKPAAYSRGAGYAWQFGDGLDNEGMLKRCRDEHPEGCVMDGLVAYPRCKPGYHSEVGFMCSRDCPPGFGTDIGVSCTKKTYTRTAGVPRTCGPGMEQDGPAGLCYPRSREGFHRVGPVYWQNCEPGWTDCGAGCQRNADPVLGIDAPWRDCASTISDQVSSVVMLAVNIGTLGLAAPETQAARAGMQTVKVGGKVLTGGTKAGRALVKIKNLYDEVKPSTLAKNYKVVRMFYNPRTRKVIENLKQTYDVANVVYDAQSTFRTTFSEDFAEQTSSEIAARIDAEFSPEVASYVKSVWADAQLSRLASTEAWETAQTALSVVSLADPTGVTSVVEAYAKPVCQPHMEFPRLRGSYR